MPDSFFKLRNSCVDNKLNIYIYIEREVESERDSERSFSKNKKAWLNWL